jgi:hypothetical protein
MNTANQPTPRVMQIEIHYDDGSKDVIKTVTKERTRIPLFGWTRSSPNPVSKGAYTNTAIAAMLFQTAMTRRLVNASDENTTALIKGFAHVWQDPDYLQISANAKTGS